ncbi:MAG: MASE1 domain-containing protein [Woeseia sp.]
MHASPAPIAPPGLQLRPLRWFLDRRGCDNRPTELIDLLPYAAVYTLLHGVMVAVGFIISTVPTAAVAIWPAIGLLCAVLAATPRRTWPLWIVSSVLGRLVFEILVIDNRELIAPLTFSLVNVVEAVFFALMMQKPVVQSYNQGRPLYLSIAMTIAAILAANLGGILGAIVLQVINFDLLNFWDAWRVWAAGDFVGMILVTPIAVWLMMPQIRIRRGLAGINENLAIVTLMAVLIWLATYFAPQQASRYAGAVNVGLVALLVLPVLWASLRAEFPMVAGTQLLLAVAVVLTASYGLGPFGHDVAGYLPMLAAMQLFLISTVLVVTTVSFAVLERQRAQEESSLHQRFSDLVVLLTNRLIGAGATTIDSVISDSLQLVGQFAKADRCVLLQLDEASNSATTTHRWIAEGRIGYAPEPAPLSVDNLHWVTEQFIKKGYIIFEDLDKVAPDGDTQLDALRQAVPNTVSAIYVALFADDRPIGAIGYGYSRRAGHWTNESISLMYLVGQLFANILQRKKTEQDLELYRDKLRSLAKDMTVTEERARRRTAIDLHDGIGQNLAVARMKVGQLMKRLGPDDTELTQLRNLIDDALRGTRFIISDLSPSILYELGLVPALQSLAERFELANNIACAVEESGAAWEAGNDARIAVYRAVQECLNNVARHANAATARIQICWSDDDLEIEISDDGIGFEAPQNAEFSLSAKGFGLFSMRESLAVLGGSLKIESASALGTTVRLRVPRRHKAPEA